MLGWEGPSGSTQARSRLTSCLTFLQEVWKERRREGERGEERGGRGGGRGEEGRGEGERMRGRRDEVLREERITIYLILSSLHRHARH